MTRLTQCDRCGRRSNQIDKWTDGATLETTAGIFAPDVDLCGDCYSEFRDRFLKRYPDDGT